MSRTAASGTSPSMMRSAEAAIAAAQRAGSRPSRALTRAAARLIRAYPRTRAGCGRRPLRRNVSEARWVKMPNSARAGTAFTPRLSRSRRVRRAGTRVSGSAVADLLALSDVIAVTVAVAAREQRGPLAEPAEVPGLVALAVIRARGRRNLGGIPRNEHVAASAWRRALHLDVCRLFHGTFCL